MQPETWQDEHAYDYCEKLNAEQWAWEFLRRNPEYQQQWQQFQETWQALEAVYGKPPDRDFCAWKNDPRAWVPASECADGDCRIDQDKVLIECALGACWGFHKFPPNPLDDDPVGEGRLSWRKTRDELLPVMNSTGQELSDEEMALVFDLSLPLRPQMDLARRQLQLEARQRSRDGILEFKRVKLLGRHWRGLLQILDGLSSGNMQAVEARFSRSLCQEANRMMQQGYLELLSFPE
jgi:hypothetical protein